MVALLVILSMVAPWTNPASIPKAPPKAAVIVIEQLSSKVMFFTTELSPMQPKKPYAPQLPEVLKDILRFLIT